MSEWPYSDLLPLLRKLCDSLSKALNKTPDEGDPVKECEQELQRVAVNTTEAEYIRAQAYGQLCSGQNFSDAPLKWRRLYEESCLHIAHIHTRCAVGNAGSEISWWKQGRKPQPKNTPKEKFIEDIFRLNWLDDVVAALDMAIIMVGAPKRRDVILNEFLPLLQEIATVQDRVSVEYAHYSGTLTSENYGTKNGGDGQNERSEQDQERPKKRRRLSSQDTALSFSPYQITHPSLSRPLPRLTNPTLEEFQQRLNKDHRDHEEPLPLILTDSIEHWPARQSDRWSNPQYLLSCTLNGRRLVPIETGRSYTDDGWGQRIIPFRKFLGQFVDLSEAPGSFCASRSDEESGDGVDEEEIDGTVYLAQYNLLSQIPGLREDISVPDYCYSEPPVPRDSHQSSTSSDATSKASPGSQSPSSSDADLFEPKINAWLGPADTISPLHTDPHHNILAQVYGQKYVRLYSPRFTANLYPRQSEMVGEKAVDMSNTSRIDLDIAMLAVENKQLGKDACEVDDNDAESDGDGDASDVFHANTDRSKTRKDFMTEFPLFEKAEYVEAILEPGDCLFIPKGWWHYVRSLNASFSVSFWWD